MGKRKVFKPVGEYLGETFMDKDPRSRGRTIKVLRVARDGIVGEEQFEVEVVEHYLEKNIGRITTVTRRTLDQRYKKVSH